MTQQNQIAIWLFAVGGVGARSAKEFVAKFRADGCSFPVIVHQFDTDPSSLIAEGDVFSFIGLSESQLKTMLGSPARFGPHCREMLQKLHPYFNGDVTAGARTLRPFTQLYWMYNRERIISDLRRSLELLAKKPGAQVIVPMILSSAGGGTGSALTVLLMRAFVDVAFMQQVRLGIRSQVDRPVVFVVDPYEFPRTVGRSQATRILANMYALRLESDYLLRQHAAAQYIFHLGFSNNPGGVILDNPLTMAAVLGRTSYVLARDWIRYKSALVDGVDNNIVSDTGYMGHDTLELLSRDPLPSADVTLPPTRSAPSAAPPSPPAAIPPSSGEST